jgi:catechol-2,3-dioxygenase
MLKVEKIFETVLYAEDIDSIIKFYKNILGLKIIQQSEMFVAFRCEEVVLLVFDPRKTNQSGRNVPSHGAEGPGHIAFSIEPEELDAWREQLVEKGVEIEAEVNWKSGGQSIYFRDPAGNSVELAIPTLWRGD